MDRSQPRNTRQGISAEVYGQFNQKQTFVPPVVPKNACTKESIAQLVKESILFQNLTEDDIQTLVDAMTINQIENGEIVIKEQEKG